MLSRRSQHIVELLGMYAPTGTFPFPFLEAEHFLSAIRISFSVVEHCSSPQFDRTAAWRSKEHAEFQLVVVCVHVVSGTTRVQPRVRAFGNFWLQTSRARGVVIEHWQILQRARKPARFRWDISSVRRPHSLPLEGWIFWGGVTISHSISSGMRETNPPKYGSPHTSKKIPAKKSTPSFTPEISVQNTDLRKDFVDLSRQPTSQESPENRFESA